MPEEVVSPQEETEQAAVLTETMADDSAEIQQDIQTDEQPQQEDVPDEEMVPLSALKKERKKRQEKEWELEYERKQKLQAQQPEEESYEEYESLTKKDLGRIQQETIRMVEEKNWVRENRERFEYVNDNLEEFLKQRPHLTSAIKDAPNRYEEAWLLMNALSPKQQQMLRKPPPKKEAPNSPSAVPKAAAMDQAVDLMSMTDQEYRAWRQQQKRR